MDAGWRLVCVVITYMGNLRMMTGWETVANEGGTAGLFLLHRAVAWREKRRT